MLHVHGSFATRVLLLLLLLSLRLSVCCCGLRLLLTCSIVESIGASMSSLFWLSRLLVFVSAALSWSVENDLVAAEHGVELLNLLNL